MIDVEININKILGPTAFIINELIMLGGLKMKILRFLRDESGATAIEYGLIAGLIAVVIISAVTSVGTKVSKQFSTVASKLN